MKARFLTVAGTATGFVAALLLAWRGSSSIDPAKRTPDASATHADESFPGGTAPPAGNTDDAGTAADPAPLRDGERRILVDRGNFRAYTENVNCADGECDT